MYLSFNEAMQKKFGKKMYKLSLDGGMTCPNRDGTVGAGGCIFCSGGSGDFAVPCSDDIDRQIEAAKAIIGSKSGNCGYIAYFQSYSNTYASVSYLEKLFRPIITRPDISALAIATRPDCLPDETICLLKELNSIKPVWVELGLQTIHESTANYIRRGYPLSAFEDAMDRLSSAGIETVVHMIIGLPGETEDMIYSTAEYIGRSGAKGIKLHLLHVLEGTDLADDYRSGKFSTLSMEEYIHILGGCINRLPPDMVIHRLTGDGAKKLLIAPLWSGDKKRVLNEIKRTFIKDGVCQGSLYNKR